MKIPFLAIEVVGAVVLILWARFESRRPKLHDPATFILSGCLFVWLAVFNIASSINDWKQGKYDFLPMDAFYLVGEVFGAVLCLLCARLELQGRKRDRLECDRQAKIYRDRKPKGSALPRRSF
jgi:hypothetical protein